MRHDLPRWPLHGPLLGAVCLLVFLGVLLLGCVKALAEPDEVPALVGTRILLVGFCLDTESGWIGVRQIQHARSLKDDDRAGRILRGVFADPLVQCVHAQYNRFRPIPAIVEEVVEVTHPAGAGCTLWVRVRYEFATDDDRRAITWRRCDVNQNQGLGA